MPHQVRKVPPDTYPASTETVDLYKNLGDGTIQVAGSTRPNRAALRALTVWKRGVYPIEFFSLGSNAGGEAVKSARAFIRMLFVKHGVHAAIVPRWNSTVTTDPQSGKTETKQGMVLRIIEIPSDHVG